MAARSPGSTAATPMVEVTYLTWTEDNMLRQVSYQGTLKKQ